MNPNQTHKGMTFPPEPLTPEEVLDMIEVADADTVVGIRIRALIGVLFGAGLRINEALSLMPRDINVKEGSVFVRQGKGKKDRRIGIDQKALAYVSSWLEKREELGLERGQPLFCGYRGVAKGRAISRRYVSDQLKDLAVKAGIEKRVHPHGLRHSMAYDLANNNVPVHQIQRQLGHTKLDTTSI